MSNPFEQTKEQKEARYQRMLVETKEARKEVESHIIEYLEEGFYMGYDFKIVTPFDYREIFRYGNMTPALKEVVFKLYRLGKCNFDKIYTDSDSSDGWRLELSDEYKEYLSIKEFLEARELEEEDRK